METVTPVQAPDRQPDRTWMMLCHLSCLAGLVFPFGNFLGPLIVWLIKKEEMPEVDRHGKAALNFQITISLGVAVSVAAGFFLSFFVVGFLLFPVAGLIGILGLVFGVVAAIKTSEGKDYTYPFSLNLVS